MTRSLFAISIVVGNYCLGLDFFTAFNFKRISIGHKDMVCTNLNTLPQKKVA